MKKYLLGVILIAMISMLAACGNDQDTFELSADTALTNARMFVSEAGNMDQILEVIDTYEYTNEEGAKAIIFEVRLGTDKISVASKDQVKVWRNNSLDEVHVSWSSEEELNEKKEQYK